MLYATKYIWKEVKKRFLILYERWNATILTQQSDVLELHHSIYRDILKVWKLCFYLIFAIFFHKKSFGGQFNTFSNRFKIDIDLCWESRFPKNC